jgi:hypothetical protein
MPIDEVKVVNRSLPPCCHPSFARFAPPSKINSALVPNSIEYMFVWDRQLLPPFGTIFIPVPDQIRPARELICMVRLFARSAFQGAGRDQETARMAWRLPISGGVWSTSQSKQLKRYLNRAKSCAHRVTPLPKRATTKNRFPFLMIHCIIVDMLVNCRF